MKNGVFKREIVIWSKTHVIDPFLTKNSLYSRIGLPIKKPIHVRRAE